MTREIQQKRRGFLVTFEGGDGAGKSTQIRRLVATLEKAGIPAFATLQPGGTELGHKLREIVLNPENTHLSLRAELLLYLTDRAQHVEEIVRPALDTGMVVVSDRYGDSSTVYQGLCRGFGVEWVEKLNDFATGGLMPDLTVLLDLPVEVGFGRRGKRAKADRLESEKREFHEKVRQGFLQLAKKHENRFLVLDGTMDEARLAAAIWTAVEQKWKGRGR